MTSEAVDEPAGDGELGAKTRAARASAENGTALT
jgi:hypothetical protein